MQKTLAKRRNVAMDKVVFNYALLDSFDYRKINSLSPLKLIAPASLQCPTRINIPLCKFLDQDCTVSLSRFSLKVSLYFMAIRKYFLYSGSPDFTSTI